MIRDDTRNTIKFIIWVIIIAILFYLGSIFVFFKAGKESRVNDRQIAQVAYQKTPIKNITAYYHLNRGKNSYAVQGTNKKGAIYYLIYLPTNKKAYIYSAKKGNTKKEIKQIFSKEHSQDKIKEINLGWYQGKPTWEVSYEKPSGTLGFTLYDFKTAKVVNEVDNL